MFFVKRERNFILILITVITFTEMIIGNNCYRNEIELQQLDKDVCGDYCIYFLKRMSCMEEPNLNFF